MAASLQSFVVSGNSDDDLHRIEEVGTMGLLSRLPSDFLYAVYSGSCVCSVGKVILKVLWLLSPVLQCQKYHADAPAYLVAVHKRVGSPLLRRFVS